MLPSRWMRKEMVALHLVAQRRPRPFRVDRGQELVDVVAELEVRVVEPGDLRAEGGGAERVAGGRAAPAGLAVGRRPGRGAGRVGARAARSPVAWAPASCGVFGAGLGSSPPAPASASRVSCPACREHGHVLAGAWARGAPARRWLRLRRLGRRLGARARALRRGSGVGRRGLLGLAAGRRPAHAERLGGDDLHRHERQRRAAGRGAAASSRAGHGRRMEQAAAARLSRLRPAAPRCASAAPGSGRPPGSSAAPVLLRHRGPSPCPRARCRPWWRMSSTSITLP